MAHGRSPLLLLAALAALLVLPAPALAQGDPTLPVNTTDPVPSPGTWRNTPYEVQLTGTDVEDPLVDMQYRLGALGAITTVPTDSIVTITDQGQHQFGTQALDDSGNVSGWRTEDLWIDTVDPTDATTVSAGWYTAPTSVSVDAVDITSGVQQVQWILDGAPIQSGPNGTDVAVSSDGSHLLRVRAVDVAGNVSDWTDHTVRVDTVNPTDTTALPAGWQTQPLNVNVTGADAHSGVTQVVYRVDEGSWTTTAAPGSFTVSAEGEHTIDTYVRDAAGRESAPKRHTIRIDTTAPTNLTPAANPAWSDEDYHVLVSANDGGGSGVAKVQWRIDGGPWLEGLNGSQADVTGTGEHTLETRALDVAGNVSLARLENIRIDKVVPTNTTTPPPGGVVGNPYQVAVTGDDDDSGVAGIEWQVDGGTIEAGDPGDLATVSGNGPHTLRTRVIDAAGNASGWRTDNLTIDVTAGDNVPPVDTTTAGSNTLWRNAPVTVTVAAVDAGSGVDHVEWRIPGQATQNGASGATVAFNTEGDHILETRAFDVAGNSTGWRRQHFKVDLSVPDDTTAIANGWQASNSFTLSATDAYSGIDEITYEIDGGGEQLGTNGQTITVGPDGEYTVVTRVTDNAGHSSAYKTSTLKVDTVDPVNTTAVPGSAWSPEPLELDLTGTDARSGLDKVQWRVDGGAIHDGGPAIVDEDGEHVLETRAVDLAGNDTAWRSDTVRIDATAPVNTTPAAPAGWRKTAYTVVVSGDDGDGSDIDKIERTIDGGAVSEDENVTITGDGVHVLRTRIVDNVGHASAWREDTIRIDSVAPSAAVTCDGGTGGWSRAAVTCTLSADGGPSGLEALTVSRDGAASEAVASGTAVAIGDGTHTLALAATDGAGNSGGASATIYVDATAPTASLSCTAGESKHTCVASGSDATSGLAGLAYSIDGGAYQTIEAGRSFTLAKGKVTVLAVDAAGNETVTGPVTLTAPKTKTVGTTVKISSAPVYLAGHKDVDSLVGALNATRSSNGTVSLDLRPLAVGRGRYKVVVQMRSGKRKKTFSRTYKVGSTGALPRIATSLTRATERTTVKLTVRKKVGRRWRSHAGTRLVLAK